VRTHFAYLLNKENVPIHEVHNVLAANTSIAPLKIIFFIILKMKGFSISVGKYTTMIDSAIQNTQFFTFFLMLNYVAQL
jgi:hypothetical protein